MAKAAAVRMLRQILARQLKGELGERLMFWKATLKLDRTKEIRVFEGIAAAKVDVAKAAADH